MQQFTTNTGQTQGIQLHAVSHTIILSLSNRGAYGSGHSTIADAVFLCTGRETNLDDCVRHGLETSCGHVSDIAITCNIPHTCDEDEVSVPCGTICV